MIEKLITFSHLTSRQIRHLSALILSVFCFAGCSQRELCDDHSHITSVQIEFDWSDAPDATPQTMVVYFFPTDNSQYTRVELTSDGSASPAAFNTTVEIPSGTYRVVCHNGDTENNEEQGILFNSYHLTTYDVSLLDPIKREIDAPRPDDTEDQSVRAQASTLYSYTVSEPVVLKPNVDKTIVLKPRRRSVVINVTIDNIENLTPGVEFCGVISGLAESWYPSTDMPGGRDAIVPLLLVPDGESSLHGSMEVFGDIVPHDILHMFRLYTSQKYYYDFDVTDQLHSAPDPYNVNITLSGIKLPETGDGMDVSVGDWELGENIYINM